MTSGRPKFAVSGGDCQIAGQQQFQASGEGVSLCGGDPEFGSVGAHEACEAAFPGGEGGAAVGGDFLQVCAGAEGVRAGAGEDGGPNVGIVFDAGRRLVPGQRQLRR